MLTGLESIGRALLDVSPATWGFAALAILAAFVAIWILTILLLPMRLLFAALASCSESWTRIGTAMDQRRASKHELALRTEGASTDLVTPDTDPLQALQIEQARLKLAHQSFKLTREMASYQQAQEPAAEEPMRKIDVVEFACAGHYALAIIAPQRYGKTTVMRHIGAEWERQGGDVFVMSPGWDASEWGPRCLIYGPDGDAILEGIQILDALVDVRRHDRKASATPILAILDDFLALQTELGAPIRACMVKACSTYLKAGVIPCIALHGNTAEAWGLRGVGKGLADGFARIKVHKSRSSRSITVDIPGEETAEGWLPDGDPRWLPPVETASPHRDSVYHEPHHEPVTRTSRTDYEALPMPLTAHWTDNGRPYSADVDRHQHGRAMAIYSEAQAKGLTTTAALGYVADWLGIRGTRSKRLAIVKAMLGES